MAQGAAWMLTDQTVADVLTLASIDCKLQMAWVFKDVARQAR